MPGPQDESLADIRAALTVVRPPFSFFKEMQSLAVLTLHCRQVCALCS